MCACVCVVVWLCVCVCACVCVCVCVCVCTCMYVCVCLGGVFTIMIVLFWGKKKHIGGKEDICGREVVIMSDDLYHVHCSCL